ncbi:hypothetical protein [Antribacter gilvus]|uniref:hypothetical protein n=1 Tax=Antribacter gilvus TaxID=2304675 RepID=UPI000F76780B|nr:hypothetical protein [Antribacter gilvus]
MAAHRVDELPDEHARPILELLERTRAAAAPPPEIPAAVDAWAAAEAGQARNRTGYKAARRTLSAGQYAAHALRITAARDADPQPWTRELADQAGAISSWDWDTRMQAALDLRRTFKDLPEPVDATVRPVRLVAAWLTHASGPALVPVTARLAAYVLEHPPGDDVLAGAWYATHGHRLLQALTDHPHRDELEPHARRGIIAANPDTDASAQDAHPRGHSAG